MKTEYWIFETEYSSNWTSNWTPLNFSVRKLGIGDISLTSGRSLNITWITESLENSVVNWHLLNKTAWKIFHTSNRRVKKSDCKIQVPLNWTRKKDFCLSQSVYGEWTLQMVTRGENPSWWTIAKISSTDQIELKVDHFKP